MVLTPFWKVLRRQDLLMPTVLLPSGPEATLMGGLLEGPAQEQNPQRSPWDLEGRRQGWRWALGPPSPRALTRSL